MKKLILPFMLLIASPSFAGDINECENYITNKVEKIYTHLDKEENGLSRSQNTVARLAMGTILDIKNDYICKEQNLMLDDVVKVFGIKI